MMADEIPKMFRTHYKRSLFPLSQVDIDDLGHAATLAWDTAGPHTRKVSFAWRGKRFTVTCTSFRLLIREYSTRQPVACVWHP